MPPRKRTTKSTGNKPQVKMIQTIDSVPGHDTRVYFTDGTNAKVKAGNALAQAITTAEFVAPNMVQVTVENGYLTDAEVVDTSAVRE